MTQTFLSKEEIRQLTSYRYPAKQAAYLRRRGYVFETDRYGNPIILRSHLETMLGGQTNTKKRVEPDFSFIQGMRNVAKTKTKR